MTDEELREVLVKVIREDCVKDYPDAPACPWPNCLCKGEVLQPRLTFSAMRRIAVQVRAETVAEAARVAENFFDNGPIQTGIMLPPIQQKIAAAIRALLNKDDATIADTLSRSLKNV